MTYVEYKCDQHGFQYVDEVILPGNIYILNCGCVYSLNIHGSNCRIKTSCCDKCGLIIIDTCLVTSNYSTKFYHIDCAKDLGIIEKGRIVNIDEYPDYDIPDLQDILKERKKNAKMKNE